MTIGQVWNSTGSLFAVRQHWHRPGGNGCHDAGGFRCYDGCHDGGVGDVENRDDKDVNTLWPGF